jgi:hypothetical protein
LLSATRHGGVSAALPGMIDRDGPVSSPDGSFCWKHYNLEALAYSRLFCHIGLMLPGIER